MGQVKNLILEFEEAYSSIQGLISLFSDQTIEYLLDAQIMRDLFDIQEMIHKIDNNSLNNIAFVVGLFTEDFHSTYSELHKLVKKEKNVENIGTIKYLIDVLRLQIRNIRISIVNFNSSNQSIFNSENYYNDQIKNLEKQKKELQNYLEQQNSIVGKSEQEKEFQKREVIEKEIALIKAKVQINSYQKELEEKKKQENAIVEWDSKIKSTFTKLTTCLSPINKEHRRMNIMFWIYAILVMLTIISFVILEVIIICKLNKIDGFPELKGYIASVVPIPILGALLWVFIIQINRTQRQLVILAKHIHEIGYVEGLLLSLNSLSPDISNSTNRVNIAIDKLLENHLNASSTTGIINEGNIIFEERKDKAPYDMIVKMLHEIKGIVGK